MAKGSVKGVLGGVAAFLCAAFGLLLLISLPRACSETLHDKPSDVQRLPADVLIKTPYFTDEDGSWIDYPNKLVAGMREFLDETGVQPYLYVLPDGKSISSTELDQQAKELYGELFDDEAHFLVVFCDDSRGSYLLGYAVGEQAKEIVGSETIDAFEQKLNKGYYRYSTRMDEEQMFSDAFSEASKTVSGGNQKLNQAAYTFGAFLVFGFVFALAIALIGVAVLFVYALVKKRKNKEERIAALMRQPLRKFSDSKAERLARKYEQPAAPEGEPPLPHP